MATATTEGGMKGILASKFGDIDEVLDVSSDWPAPECGGAKGRELLLRVHACALGPQDVYMIHGDLDFVLKPDSFPYVPGMEVCGVVEQVAQGETRFKVGDRVAVSNGALPVGGLAEKAVMPASEAVLVPDGVSSVAAAALVNSPYCALEFVKGAKVAAGERVLVLGGSGGVGSAVVQLAKIAGAAYVAATSTDEPLLKSLGADRVINYREENFWEIEEFQTTPFDVIIDCIGTRDAWYNSKRSGVLKSGWQRGRFVAVSLISERPQVHSAFQMAQMMLPALFRSIGSILYPWVARYSFPIIMSAKGKHLKELFDLVETGRLKPVLERASPFPFTLEGVKAAFQLQASKHAHGKVVIEMT